MIAAKRPLPLPAPISVRFQLSGSKQAILNALSEADAFEAGEEDEWFWRGETVDTILGFIEVTEAYVELETNSVERADEGTALINELMGTLLGTPLRVHVNLEEVLFQDSMANDEIPEALPPELQDIVNSKVTEHYKSALDESIPMLEGHTLQECAADPALHHLVIAWLKYLESRDARSRQGGYDFSWMWQELGLRRNEFN